MHYGGNAAKFVTELQKEARFGAWAGAGLPTDDDDDDGSEAKAPSGGARLPEVTVEAAKALDNVIRGLQSSFGVINSGGGDNGADGDGAGKGSASGSVCTDYFEVLGRSLYCIRLDWIDLSPLSFASIADERFDPYLCRFVSPTSFSPPVQSARSKTSFFLATTTKSIWIASSSSFLHSLSPLSRVCERQSSK